MGPYLTGRNLDNLFPVFGLKNFDCQFSSSSAVFWGFCRGIQGGMRERVEVVDMLLDVIKLPDISVVIPHVVAAEKLWQWLSQQVRKYSLWPLSYRTFIMFRERDG